MVFRSRFVVERDAASPYERARVQLEHSKSFAGCMNHEGAQYLRFEGCCVESWDAVLGK